MGYGMILLTPIFILQKGGNIGVYARVMKFGFMELFGTNTGAHYEVWIYKSKRSYLWQRFIYEAMEKSASHYWLTILRNQERAEEHVTQRREKIRYAKRLPCGINLKTSLEMGVVSYMVDCLLAHKRRKDAKLFAKATEEGRKLDKLLLASNRDSVLNL